MPSCLRFELLSYCRRFSSGTASEQDQRRQPSDSGSLLQPAPMLSDEQHERIRRLAAATASRQGSRPPRPFETWLELEVYLQLSELGYNVIPQFKIASGSIDLVIEGQNARLAVGCDSDQWGGPEQYQKDLALQQKLERCGWIFFRIRGSEFMRHPTQVLERLQQKLKHQKIFPKKVAPLLQVVRAAS
jgi:very-short-patch-repair endonuclease